LQAEVLLRPTHERSVIGAVLKEPALFDDVRAELKSGDFFDELPRRVFQAFEVLRDCEESITLLNVEDALRANGVTISKDTLFELESIAKNTIVSTSMAVDVRAVQKAAISERTRRILKNALAKIERGRSHQDAVSKMLEQLGDNVDSVEGPKHASQIVDDALKRLEGGNEVPTVPFCIGALDKHLGGMTRGRVTLLGGRPGTGKTALSCHVARMCANRGLGVLFVSMEMSEGEVIDKMMSAEAGIDLRAKRDQRWHQRAVGAYTKLSESMLSVWEISGVSADEVIAGVKAFRKNHRIDLVIIDYVQLFEGGSAGESRVTVLSTAARKMKTLLARKLDVAVLAIVQMNREIERSKRDPQMSDIKDCGALEDNADQILFLRPLEEDSVKAHILKARFGPSGLWVPVGFKKPIQRFFDVGHT